MNARAVLLRFPTAIATVVLVGLAPFCVAEATTHLPDATEQALRAEIEVLEREPDPSRRAVAAAHEKLGGYLLRLQRYAEAESLFRRALALERELGISAESYASIIDTLRELAFAVNAQGRPDEADNILAEALQVTLRQKGSEHLDVGERQNELAMLALRRGDLHKAISHYEEALSIFERLGGPGHPKVVPTLDVLGLLYAQVGDTDAARRHYAQSLELVERQGLWHRKWLKVALFLAADAMQTGHCDDARRLYDVTATRLDGVVSEQPNQVAELLWYLGKCLASDGQDAPALAAFERTVDIVQKELNADPLWLGPLLFEISEIRKKRGEIAEAVALLERVTARYLVTEQVDPLLQHKVAMTLGRLRRDLGELEAAARSFDTAFVHAQALTPSDPQRVGDALESRAEIAWLMGDIETARDLSDQALRLIKQTYGPESAELEDWFVHRGLVRSQLGRTADAEHEFRNALDLAAAAGRGDTALSAFAEQVFADFLTKQGRYEEARQHYRNGLAIYRALKPADLERVAALTELLGRAESDAGLHEESIRHFKEAKTLFEGLLGSYDQRVATLVEQIGHGHFMLGRFQLAEQDYRRALEIWSARADRPQPDAARTHRKLAELLVILGKLDEAVTLNERALALDQAAYGPNDPRLVPALNSLAAVFAQRGHNLDAAELQVRALLILEDSTRPNQDPFLLAETLIGLAQTQQRLGDHVKALELLRRARALLDGAAEQDPLRYATALGRLLQALDVTDGNEAEQRELESIARSRAAAVERVFGSDHFQTALAQFELARVKLLTGKVDEAIALYRAGYELFARRYAPDHPMVSLAFELLPFLYLADGQTERAQELVDTALAGNGSDFGETHSLTGLVKLVRGVLAYHRGDLEAALEDIRAATASERYSLSAAGRARAGGVGQRPFGLGMAMPIHVALLDQISQQDPQRRIEALREAFEITQVGAADSAEVAIHRMAARFAAGDDALAAMIRERQNAVDSWRLLNQQLLKVSTQPMAERRLESEQDLRRQVARTDSRIRELDDSLQREFPGYSELTNRRPVPLVELQRLLEPDEALLLYTSTKRRTIPALEALLDEMLPGATSLWVVRRDQVALLWLEPNREDLDEAVKRIRATLDPTGLQIRSKSDIPPFAKDEAFQLYRKIFAPAAPYLAGARHLFVVGDRGGLQSLPFGVLLTQRPAVKRTALRRLPWLLRDYAFTTLPSVSSLRALRNFTRQSSASTPLIAFGDPALSGKAGETRGLIAARLFRGKLADVNEVRRLQRLPDTADELRTIARSLGSSEERLYLGEHATEAQVKSLSLSEGRVIAFATHGLIAGELPSNSEPALVLTPPAQASDLDDGLLTASEIARLELDSDWVILSACNTAAADGTPGAQGLSGLARAFFHAGSRALLVSHWPVVSSAATALTTGMFTALSEHPEIRRAEALRRSMLTLANSRSILAHPMFWAPFVVVGEGGPQTP